MSKEALISYFKWLDAVREGGSQNMWGGALLLHQNFDLSKEESRKVHSQWMQSFDLEMTAEGRVAKVLG